MSAQLKKVSRQKLKEDLYPEVENLLKPFAKNFTVRTGMVRNKRDYNLIVDRPIEVGGRKRDCLYFASVIDQKGYVGFYFTLINNQPAFKKYLSDLLKVQKGQSCFHIRKLTPELRAEIKSALNMGFDYYKKQGWL